MKISYNWLRKYINLDGIEITDLDRILTDIGLEVDNIEKKSSLKSDLKGVVLGRIISTEKHPDADKLKLTKVDIGLPEPLSIVCGAPNAREGILIPVATIGTELIIGEDKLKIKKSKIRGEESFGMLCSGVELGISEDHSGLLEFNTQRAVGTNILEVLSDTLGEKAESDYLIEIGLTPNRIDAASHIGVARDLAVWFNHAFFKEPKNYIKRDFLMPSIKEGFSLKEPKNIDKESFAKYRNSVVVESKDKVKKYLGVWIDGVVVQDSPKCIKKRLQSIGINPKNSIVDITNFILHELGQPLHCFDGNSFKDGKVVIRDAKSGEKLKTLDGVDRELTQDDLVIASSTEALCLAGVIGGESSGVTKETTKIFLEVACFDPTTVRKSSKKHQVSSDASFRFERGTDVNMPEFALERAVALILGFAGGKVVSEVETFYEQVLEPVKIEVSIKRINSLIGIEIPTLEILNILDSLEIKWSKIDEDRFLLAVPLYRIDVTREADIVEEIVRIYGINNIEIDDLMRVPLSTYQFSADKRIETEGKVSDLLIGAKVTEIMSNSLVNSAYQNIVELEKKAVEISNPLSSDLGILRTTLLFNSLEAVSRNINRQSSNLAFFEWGNIYFVDDKVPHPLKKYKEVASLGITLTGNKSIKNWNSVPEKYSFFDVKDKFELILKRFGFSSIDLNCDEDGIDALLSDGVSYSFGKKRVAQMGEVRSKVLEKFGVKQSVFYLEIDFDVLYSQIKSRAKMEVTELPKFQHNIRDLSMLLDEEITFKAVYDVVVKSDNQGLIDAVTLFDIYKGDKLPAGRKSYAITVKIHSKEKQIEDRTLDEIMDKAIESLEKELGAEIRKG